MGTNQLFGPDEMVTAIERAIEGADRTPGMPYPWQVSPLLYDEFPGDPGNVAPSWSFAVGLLESVPWSGDRQRASGEGTPAGGITMETEVAVRWIVRFAVNGRRAAFSQALKGEVELVTRLRSIEGVPGLSLRITRILGRILRPKDLLFVNEIRASVLHRYPLTRPTP